MQYHQGGKLQSWHINYYNYWRNVCIVNFTTHSLKFLAWNFTKLKLLRQNMPKCRISRQKSGEGCSNKWQRSPCGAAKDSFSWLGGHPLGFSHCSSFKNRIHNFNSTTDVNPSIHPSFAASLRSTCQAKNNAKNAGVPMDPSSTSFDNAYYKLIFQQKALFSSDKALLDSPKTKNLAKWNLQAQKMHSQRHS